MMRVLVTGATGQLGSYLLRELCGHALIAWSGRTQGVRAGVTLQPVELADADAVGRAFREARPDVVIHTAALARVADTARDPVRAAAVNTAGTTTLAELAGAARARLIYVSTDLVFDGERGWYRESDLPAPLSVYGRTKRAGELPVLGIPGGVVIRVSLLYGPSIAGRPTFYDEQVMALRAGQPIRLFHDEWRTPLSLATAARALACVACSDFGGLLHLGGPERLSRLEMGQRLARSLGVASPAIRAVSRVTASAGEPRPRDTSLDASRFRTHFPDIAFTPFPVS
jgi:dTDP-4-dehydrorhamnose reductase